MKIQLHLKPREHYQTFARTIGPSRVQGVKGNEGAQFHSEHCHEQDIGSVQQVGVATAAYIYIYSPINPVK